MNERIKQIAGQALDQAVPQTWTTLTAYDLNKFTEAFAELLVRECCSIADEFEVYVNQGGLVDRIKEHFGVDQ